MASVWAVLSLGSSLSMPIIVASLLVNLLVAGFFGLVIGFSLRSMLPKLDVVFGPDTPSRRILACLYLAIAAVSAVALLVVPLRMGIVVVLLPLQILYKTLTVFFVGDWKNPVPWWNLAICAIHAASLWIAFSGQGVD